MSPRVTRHFVTVNGRRIHYHRAGEGPAVAMLHASPCSGKVLREPQQVFASRFTALAFDTPGFGLSDLLPMKQPEIEDFADTLAVALTELGIEQVATYGRHTGACTAVEFAARHPARCAMALTDGYPIFSAGQLEERMTKYLVPLVPSFDGAHLLWLWFRYRDQHVFWPWHDQRLGTASDADVPDLDFLHRGVVELLEAGDDYRVGYATAYRHRGLKALPDLTVPVCFGNRPGDSQHKTMKLYPPEAWQQEMPRDSLAAARAELEILLKHPAKGTAPAAPEPAPIAGRTSLDYVDLGDAQILVRSMGDLQAGPPVLVLHHAPGSSALYDPLVAAIGAKRGALAIDLPGHGESDPLPGGEQSVEVWAATVLRVLDALKIGAVHLYGHNGGAAVALELAARVPGRVKSLALDAPICLVDPDIAHRWLEGVEPVEPSWEGAHLLRVWHMRRDMEIWWPWYDQRAANRRRTEPRISPERLTLEVREMLKQPRSFAPAWGAVLDYPLRRRLAQSAHPVLLMTAEEDVFAPCLSDARSLRPDARVAITADTSEARAALLLGDLA